MFSDKSPSTGRHCTKECKINTSQLTNAILNTNNGRYKFKNVGTIEIMTLTYIE
jgi:hypothetical protein